MPPSVAVSFSGCGFLAAFHMGALEALISSRVPIAVVGGASGGALVAAGHAMGVPPTTMLSRLIDTAAKCRRDGFSSIPRHLNDVIQATLPPEVDVAQLSSLRVAVTCVWPYERVLVDRFDSREDLIAALETSCHIPFYLGSFARVFRGRRFFVDGGDISIFSSCSFRSTLTRAGLGSIAPPLKGDRVITVLSFPTQWIGPMLPSHVKEDLSRVIAPPPGAPPIRNVATMLRHALVPPSEDILRQLFDLGKAEGTRFVERRM